MIGHEMSLYRVGRELVFEANTPKTRCSGGRAAQFSMHTSRPFAAPLNAAFGACPSVKDYHDE